MKRRRYIPNPKPQSMDSDGFGFDNWTRPTSKQRIRKSKTKRISAIIAFVCIVLAIGFLSSCKASKPEIRYVPVESVKTVIETVHDTTVVVKLVPYKEETVTPKDSSYLENPYAYSWAWYRDGLLHHNLGIFDREIPVKIQYVDRIVTDTIKVPYPVIEYVKVNEPTTWQTIRIWFGQIFMGLIGLGLILLVLKWKRLF